MEFLPLKIKPPSLCSFQGARRPQASWVWGPPVRPRPALWRRLGVPFCVIPTRGPTQMARPGASDEGRRGARADCCPQHSCCRPCWPLQAAGQSRTTGQLGTAHPRDTRPRAMARASLVFGETRARAQRWVLLARGLTLRAQASFPKFSQTPLAEGEPEACRDRPGRVSPLPWPLSWLCTRVGSRPEGKTSHGTTWQNHRPPAGGRDGPPVAAQPLAC